MELRVLRYFLAVARDGSISAAAESLHLSQPTLSTQLKALEDELGKPLLIRGVKGSRRVLLTEEGQLLKKRAEEILKLVSMTERELTQSSDIIAGDVYIGAGESDALRLVARVARRLNESYDIRYHLESGNTAYVKERLDKGLIDFGIVYGEVDADAYDSVSLPCADRWGVLMRRDSPLAALESIEPRDIQNQPLIISAQRSDWSPISEWLVKYSDMLHVVATYNLIFNASLMVDEELGYALCFDKLINVTGDSRLCFRPLSPAVEEHASIIWKKYKLFSRAARKFIDELQRECDLS